MAFEKTRGQEPAFRMQHCLTLPCATDQTSAMQNHGTACTTVCSSIVYIAMDCYVDSMTKQYFQSNSQAFHFLQLVKSNELRIATCDGVNCQEALPLHIIAVPGKKSHSDSSFPSQTRYPTPLPTQKNHSHTPPYKPLCNHFSWFNPQNLPR